MQENNTQSVKIRQNCHCDAKILAYKSVIRSTEQFINYKAVTELAATATALAVAKGFAKDMLYFNI